MKKKRSKPQSSYRLQVWWRPQLSARTRRLHILNEIQNLEETADFRFQKERCLRIPTLADYFSYSQNNQLDLIYDHAELEKIRIITLNNDSNQPLKTLILKLNKANKWVIALHAWGENMYLALHQTRLLAGLGFNVLTFNVKGHGQTYGEATDFGFESYKDLKRVIIYLKLHHQMDHYALVGMGSGASTIIRYLQKHHHHDPQLRFVISDCAFSNFDKVIAEYCQARYQLPWRQINQVARDKFKALFGFEPRRYDLSKDERMKRISNVPILFIHGEKNNLINLDHAHQLYRKKIKFEKPHRSQLLIVPQANHKESLIKGGELYVKGVMNFLKELKEVV